MEYHYSTKLNGILLIDSDWDPPLSSNSLYRGWIAILHEKVCTESFHGIEDSMQNMGMYGG